jgi:hypothetical protein
MFYNIELSLKMATFFSLMSNAVGISARPVGRHTSEEDNGQSYWDDKKTNLTHCKRVKMEDTYPVKESK